MGETVSKGILRQITPVLCPVERTAVAYAARRLRGASSTLDLREDEQLVDTLRDAWRGGVTLEDLAAICRIELGGLYVSRERIRPFIA